jgi:hypothetical protein
MTTLPYLTLPYLTPLSRTRACALSFSLSTNIVQDPEAFHRTYKIVTSALRTADRRWQSILGI